MRLLLDANISWRLKARLTDHFDECLHADGIGLTVPAADIEIWNFALQNDLVIVTNDEDFLNFSNVKGFPPKVILLRVGNQNTQQVADLLIKHQEAIRAFVSNEEYGLLEII